MKYLYIFLLSIFVVLSCDTSKKTDVQQEVEVINQVFPDVIRNLSISLIEIPYPPPTYQLFKTDELFEVAEDSLVHYNLIKPSIEALNDYKQAIQEMYLDAMAFGYDSINTTVAIRDSLAGIDYFYEESTLKKIQPYLGEFDKTNNNDVSFNLDEIDNTGRFNLQSADSLNWKPGVNKNTFRNVDRGYYLAGLLQFSRVTFNKDKTRAVFYCIELINGKEAFPLLFFAKKIDGNWEIDSSEFLF